MSNDATMVAPQGFPALVGAISDAALAREWIGDAPVETALKRMVAEEPRRSLARHLEEAGALTPLQAAQLSLVAPVRLVGDFEILRQLGAGAMGEVWVARRVGERQEVALKTIGARFVAQGDFIQRFEREADLIAGLHHPHIAAALARGTEQGAPWLAMEFVKGPTLQDIQQQHGALAEAEVLHIALQVSKALEYAWSQEALVHRDIKPGNILIDRSGRPSEDTAPLSKHDMAKVIDFGLAKSTTLEEGHQDMTMTGVVMGTPSYMSPEQIHGLRDLDHRADQYALGATVFHLLTNQVPYEGASSATVITGHLNAPVPDPGDRVPSLRPGTRQLLKTCLAKKPEDRFGSWAAFQSAIEAVFQEMGNTPTPSIRLLRKPMVLPNSLRKTPLPGSVIVDPPVERSAQTTTPRPASGIQPIPDSLSKVPSENARPKTAPILRTPLPIPSQDPSSPRPTSSGVHRTPLPSPSRSGEQALAQVMTDRIRKHRDPAEGVAPLIAAAVARPPSGAFSPSGTPSSGIHRRPAGSEVIPGPRSPDPGPVSVPSADPAMFRNLVILAVVALALVGVIVLVP